MTEVSRFSPVLRCSGLASRWHDCRCGLEGQEISDADHPQYLAFKRAYAVPEPDREVARRFRVTRMSANRWRRALAAGGPRWSPTPLSRTTMRRTCLKVCPAAQDTLDLRVPL